ncbi:DUF1330 domain-containing protein [Halomonas sp. SpR8]|uniref:DUF1330 domain-containing protein n=1 Tax=Halomonas sp. SpR8 TaxID=3050463 RepID=UPI0027E3D4BA|nr:DUF1330 domain-containing protein [Halomonas sp. SpR8]MDQ7728259.1 DUF1330 domain-containing protein [Halomonas sp. SpR8]
MRKGYWIANVTVLDAKRYAEYQALAPAALAQYGANFLARGSERVTLEGNTSHTRSVIMEFPSYEQALACYHSEGYQRAKAAREGAADVNIDIIEGL